MNRKRSFQLSTFVNHRTLSPTSTSMCFHSQNNEKQDYHPGLCGCQRAPKSHCISAIGVMVLVIAYTTMGSILFVTLEGENGDSTSTIETAVAASKPYPRNDLINAEIRTRTVDRLWSITEDLNILYKENWTRLAAQEVQHFQDTLLRAVQTSKVQHTGVQVATKIHKWSYASAFLYSLTLITTIGYGSISPRTQWGRMAALIYALFGIPIVLLYLSAMGEGLSACIRCVVRRTRSSPANSSSSKSNMGSKKSPSDSTGTNIVHHHHHISTKLHSPYQLAGSPSVPISICIMILICYITLGAVLFHKIQNWGVLESLYFCFTSLGTIGFGDLTPSGNLSQYMASGYILIGMAVVAMCFSLIQTELILWLRKFGMQDQVITPVEDVALVSVSVTPKS